MAGLSLQRHGNEALAAKSAPHGWFNYWWRVRGGIWGHGVFLCAHMSSDTHTRPSEPCCPSIFGLPSSFTASSSPPSARHSELLTMATYVPTGKARDMPLGPCSLHANTKKTQPDWHDKPDLIQRFRVTWQLQTHLRPNTFLHTPSEVRSLL